jgi:chemosensory pili system protein ChpC
MQQQVDELYSLLVPLHQMRLIVPRPCIVEVVRYMKATTAGSGPSWYRGLVDWNALKVPVVCFEDLCGVESIEPGPRTRVAIFHAISGILEAGVFGILTQGFPQLVRVNREVMEPADRHSWPEDGPVICQLRMINEYPIIPDLEHIEHLLQRQLTEASATVA